MDSYHRISNGCLEWAKQIAGTNVKNYYHHLFCLRFLKLCFPVFGVRGVGVISFCFNLRLFCYIMTFLSLCLSNLPCVWEEKKRPLSSLHHRPLISTWLPTQRLEMINGWRSLQASGSHDCAPSSLGSNNPLFWISHTVCRHSWKLAPEVVEMSFMIPFFALTSTYIKAY